MSKIFETGHAINVAHFEDIIVCVIEYGAIYNPDKPSITLASLQARRAEAANALQNVTNHLVDFSGATNDRFYLFDGLKPLSTRLLNRLQATDASAKTIEDAKGANRKIQGIRAKKSADNANPDAKTISTSQQSYNQLMEHFSKLIAILSAEPSYHPNEVDLQVNTLNNLLNDMRAKNTAAAIAYAKLTTARIERNKLIYDNDDSLLNLAQDVKKYAKSLFSATSPEFKRISKISFKKNK